MFFDQGPKVNTRHVQPELGLRNQHASYVSSMFRRWLLQIIGNKIAMFNPTGNKRNPIRRKHTERRQLASFIQVENHAL
jgi:hypothetical protein